MTPDITELDEDYEPRGDSNITVNGKLPGNGGDGLWTTDDDGNLVPVDASAVSVEKQRITGEADITYAVPSDFATLHEALNAAGADKVRSGVQVEITIESGHSISTNVELTNGDWSHVIVRSADNTVPITADTSGPQAILLEDCEGPTFDVVFDAANATRHGLRLRDGSEAIITDGGGVINAPANNVDNVSSELIATGATFTGAGEGTGDLSDPDDWAGVNVIKGGFAFIDGADTSNSTYGVRAGDNSRVVYQFGTATDCDRRGVSANRSSRVFAQETDTSRAGENCVFSSNTSLVDLRNGTANDAGSFAFRSRRGAQILADRSEATGATDGTFVMQGGYIHAADLPSTTDTDLWAADDGDLTPDQNPVAIRHQSGLATEAGMAIIDGEGLSLNDSWSDHALSVQALDGAQSINANEQTRVQFNTVQSDVFGNWDATNYEWTVPFDGIWRVTAVVQFTDSSDGDQLRLWAGRGLSTGSPNSAETAATGHTGNLTTLRASREVDVNAGGTLAAEVINEDGADQLNNFDAQTFFQVSFVRFRKP